MYKEYQINQVLFFFFTWYFRVTLSLIALLIISKLHYH